MSNIRDIVRRHVVSETEQELKSRGINPTQISEMVDMLAKKGHFDKEIDNILNAFKDEIELHSPSKKRYKINRISFTAINIILTTFIGYAVNKNAWEFVWGLAGIYILISAYFILVE